MRVLVPEAFHPQLQFRYTVYTSKLIGSSFYARSAQQPAFDNNPIKVDYQGGYFKVKGKTNWQDISIRCYQFEGITLPDFWKYVQQHQFTRPALDQYNVVYKHDLRLVLLNPTGLPIGTWKLIGAFYSSVNFGDLDWGSDSDVAEIDLSICYDYAEFVPFVG